MADSKLDHDEVKALADILDEKGLTEIEVEADGRRIRVARAAVAPVALPAPPAAPGPGITETTAASEAKQPETASIREIKSPMVGTFYVAASPDSPPFVEVGDSVRKRQTVCIIEAMKLMNEIESEYDGEVIERLVQNSESVEFEQPLFRIATD